MIVGKTVELLHYGTLLGPFETPTHAGDGQAPASPRYEILNVDCCCRETKNCRVRNAPNAGLGATKTILRVSGQSLIMGLVH